MKNSRKDTGYSTGSSHTSTKNHIRKTHSKQSKNSKEHPSVDSKKSTTKQKLKRSDKETKGRRKFAEDALSEKSEPEDVRRSKTRKTRSKESKYDEEPTLSVSTSEASSE